MHDEKASTERVTIKHRPRGVTATATTTATATSCWTCNPLNEREHNRSVARLMRVLLLVLVRVLMLAVVC